MSCAASGPLRPVTTHNPEFQADVAGETGAGSSEQPRGWGSLRKGLTVVLSPRKLEIGLELWAQTAVPRPPRCRISPLSSSSLEGMGAEYLGESLASDHLSVKRSGGGTWVSLLSGPGWGSGGLLPGRAVSESEGMPGAAILLETHTQKS